jgi:hypothetical protein
MDFLQSQKMYREQVCPKAKCRRMMTRRCDNRDGNYGSILMNDHSSHDYTICENALSSGSINLVCFPTHTEKVGYTNPIVVHRNIWQRNDAACRCIPK